MIPLNLTSYPGYVGTTISSFFLHMADLALSVADRIIIFPVPVTNRQSSSCVGRAIGGGPSSCVTLRLCLRLLQYKLHIISLAGDLKATFTPDPDPGFGIRNAVWHPSGMFLAVGGWDDKVQLTITFFVSYLVCCRFIFSIASVGLR
jgi:hypothetical protein